MEQQQTQVGTYARQILTQVRKAIVGKDSVLLQALAAILAGGHILMEDIPGVGKTTMALAFSKAMSLQQNRLQFTPDVLPSDVTGYSVPDPQNGQLTYRPGAILCNLFLADELNRATSRTQSALLEAMEEKQVTVDGTSHRLPQPFIVIATQNPAGAAGTQLLPDSQIDRFMVRLSLGYPSPKDEIAMVRDRQGADPMQQIQPVISAQELTNLQEQVQNTFIGEEVTAYAVELIQATRTDDRLLRGSSPRATLALVAMAKAIAQLRGRSYVVPKDVQDAFLATQAHRLEPAPGAIGQGMTPQAILAEILARVKAPKLR